MLKISIPNNNLNERKYILDIIFDEFLDLDFKVLEDDDCQDWIIELANKKVLTIKDTFFSKYPKDLEYLKLENIPSKIEKLDIFAASFFMLTRWEEYVNKNRDSHDRFPATESLAYKQGFLDRPIVNEYVEELWSALEELGIKQLRKQRKYKFIMTHDVDFTLKFKGFFQSIKMFAGDIFKRRDVKLFIFDIYSYVLTIFKFQKDPYDAFDYMMELSENSNQKAYFFLWLKG